MPCGCFYWHCSIWAGNDLGNPVPCAHSPRRTGAAYVCLLCIYNGEIGKLAQAGRRIGGRRELTGGGRASSRVRRQFGGSGDGDSNAKIPVQMIFAARRAISLARVFIAKAGEFVTPAYAIAVTSFGRGLDWDECHGFSLRQQEKHGMEKHNAQGRMSQDRRRATRWERPPLKGTG